MVKQAVNLIKVQADFKGIKIFYEISQDCPKFINTDPNRLR